MLFEITHRCKTSNKFFIMLKQNSINVHFKFGRTGIIWQSTVVNDLNYPARLVYFCTVFTAVIFMTNSWFQFHNGLQSCRPDLALVLSALLVFFHDPPIFSKILMFTLTSERTNKETNFNWFFILKMTMVVHTCLVGLQLSPSPKFFVVFRRPANSLWKTV